MKKLIALFSTVLVAACGSSFTPKNLDRENVGYLMIRQPYASKVAFENKKPIGGADNELILEPDSDYELFELTPGTYYMTTYSFLMGVTQYTTFQGRQQVTHTVYHYRNPTDKANKINLDKRDSHNGIYASFEIKPGVVNYVGDLKFYHVVENMVLGWTDESDEAKQWLAEKYPELMPKFDKHLGKRGPLFENQRVDISDKAAYEKRFYLKGAE